MFYRQKSLLTAVILAAFVFVGFVNSSEAIEIISFPSNTEDTSYNGYTYHMAYVKTDVPIYHVSWFIDDTWVYGETLDSSTDYASYYPYDKIPGVIKGKKYEIGVKVWEWDDDDGVFRSTTASYTVRVFEPKTISGTKYPPGIPRPKRGNGIYGYVELSRHYHDGQNIVVDGFVYANNMTEVKVQASSWFRHTLFDENGITLWSVEDPRSSKPLPAGKPYSEYGSSMISYYVGGDIDAGERFKLNAHIHLDVDGQVWHEQGGAWTHTFDYKDNESYEGD